MSDLLDVRLPEWGSLDPSGSTAAEVALRGLELEDRGVRAIACALGKAKVLVVDELRTGIAIHATSFVGRIQLGRLRITVEPKIGRNALLTLFRYAFGLRRLTLFASTSAETGALFQDVLLEQLRSEIDELRRRGLMQRYVARSDALACPRGRVDVARLASRGGVIDASLPCRHSPREVDHVLNRVLVAGLALGVRLAQTPDLKRELLELRRKIDPAIQAPLLDRRLLESARLSLSRLTSSYEPTLRLLNVLLDGLALDLGDGETLAVPGFVFDMNRFFQSLVERVLVDHLPGHQVHAERGIRGMLAYVQNPTNRRAPQPRPDFTITRPGTAGALLLDAKYRDLWEKPLPREMLYQLALYAVSQREGKTAAIVYPSVWPAARDASVEVRHPVDHARIAMVHLRPLPIEALANAVAEERLDVVATIAKRAAFGASAEGPPDGVLLEGDGQLVSPPQRAPRFHPIWPSDGERLHRELQRKTPRRMPEC